MALAWEGRPLMRARKRWPELRVLVTGAGSAASGDGARRAVEAGAGVLVSWGTAGSLGSARAGEIVLASSAACDGGQGVACDPLLAGRIAGALDGVAKVHRAPVVSVDRPVASPAEKHRLADRTGAAAVDMESATVCWMASQAGLPAVVLRVIVDGPDQAVPAAAIAAMDGPRTRIGPLLAALVKSPRQAGDLCSLALAARRARSTLAACADRVPSILADAGNRSSDAQRIPETRPGRP